MRFSIKKIWWISSLCGAGLASQSSFQARLDVRAGWNAADVVSHRHRFFLEQHYRDSFQLVGSFRAQAEGIGLANRSEAWIRDLYAHFNWSPVSVKLGWQQVVWGEAFGFYFADIVNPKDLVELGLSDLEGNRITLPMLNFKSIFAGFSAQLLVVPLPSISRLPRPGTPYAFPFEEIFGAPYRVSDELRPAFSVSNTEVGARLTTELGATSLGAFYYSGLDRDPPFESSFQGTEFALDRPFYRLASVGLTSSSEAAGGVFRSEILFQPQKAHPVARPAQLTYEKADRWVGAIGYDLTWASLSLGFQLSVAARSRELEGALEPAVRPQISARLARDQDGEWELLVAYAPKDGSGLVKPSINIPLSKETELVLGAEYFFGGNRSEMGAFRDASRVTAQFRAFLRS